MFDTHYAKQRPKPRYAEDKGELLTQLESVLYSILPINKVFCKDEIIRLHKEKQSARPGYSGHWVNLVSDAIDGLVKKGYLKEIHGVRIERMISSF